MDSLHFEFEAMQLSQPHKKHPRPSLRVTIGALLARLTLIELLIHHASRRSQLVV